MKTINCAISIFAVLIAGGPHLGAQEAGAEGTVIRQRPKYTDDASHRLIGNYLAASGGKKAHTKLIAIAASGTLEEAGRVRQFRLIEMQDGRRHLTLTWRHLGRDHEFVTAYDGVIAWEQQVGPDKLLPEKLSGVRENHFKTQRWFIHPFIVPLKAKYVFQYQGGAKVAGRPAHLVRGYGPKEVKSFFYFDKATFLVTRWGGYGQVAGVQEYLDYQANRFEYVGGVLLPKEIDLLVENDAFGKISIDSVEVNPDVDLGIFMQPPDGIPRLRQRTVAP